MFFNGEHYFLHNCYQLKNPIEYKIEYPGIKFYSVETALQVARLKCDNDTAKEIATKDAYTARRLCMSLPKKGLNAYKPQLTLVRDLVFQKFENNEELVDKLLMIDDREKIIYHNDCHDNYLGRCVCEKCRAIYDRKSDRLSNINFLGRVLLNIKEYYQDERYIEPKDFYIYICICDNIKYVTKKELINIINITEKLLKNKMKEGKRITVIATNDERPHINIVARLIANKLNIEYGDDSNDNNGLHYGSREKDVGLLVLTDKDDLSSFPFLPTIKYKRIYNYKENKLYIEKY